MKSKANKTKMTTNRKLTIRKKSKLFVHSWQPTVDYTYENRTKGRIQFTTHGNQQRASKSECMKSTLVNRPAPGRLANQRNPGKCIIIHDDRHMCDDHHTYNDQSAPGPSLMNRIEGLLSSARQINIMKAHNRNNDHV